VLRSGGGGDLAGGEYRAAWAALALGYGCDDCGGAGATGGGADGGGGGDGVRAAALGLRGDLLHPGLRGARGDQARDAVGLRRGHRDLPRGGRHAQARDLERSLGARAREGAPRAREGPAQGDRDSRADPLPRQHQQALGGGVRRRVQERGLPRRELRVEHRARGRSRERPRGETHRAPGAQRGPLGEDARRSEQLPRDRGR
jgi:hypothetical protein